jgi:REP element-mobilizing transposase RayT
MQPLAYHLIWTTYGTWLPGDSRGWTRSGVAGAQSPNPVLEQRSREAMAELSVQLAPEQRTVVEQTIRDHCRIRSWILHAINIRSNHVHLIVTCNNDGAKARDELKLWTSRRLSDLAGLTTIVAHKAGRRHWWTEGGDARAIHDDDYLNNAINYVTNMQGE